MQIKKILITGATGFVGQALCRSLITKPYQLRALVRREEQLPEEIEIVFEQLNGETNWDPVLNGVEIVVHLAGRAHVLNEFANDPYQAFAEINVIATEHLVKAAAKHNIKRFVYISSTKVCGETTPTQAFTEKDPVNPQGDYAKTKVEAEQRIKAVCKNSMIEYVIIRPPLVYGKHVKANFKRLIQLSSSLWPLPLGAISNQRSLVSIDNLIDFISVCMAHPKAANQTFFVSDDHDLSTAELIRLLAKYQGKRAHLFSIPHKWLVMVFKLVKPDWIPKLLANLQVDISHAKQTLDWEPPMSVEEGLRKAVKKS